MEQPTYIETAKEVAGKAIGKHGLIYITIIVAMGVGASIVLEEGKMAAVMGLLGASLTALKLTCRQQIRQMGWTGM